MAAIVLAQKAEVLAALRELFDGAWTRHLGADGGKPLSWNGKESAHPHAGNGNHGEINRVATRDRCQGFACGTPLEGLRRLVIHLSDKGVTDKESHISLSVISVGLNEMFFVADNLSFAIHSR